MIRILHGDARDVLKTLPADSVHCCVTSPPYWGLRDYNVDGQIGLERSPTEYVDEIVAVFREVRRVIRDDATLWLNLGDSYHNYRSFMNGGQIGQKVHDRHWHGQPAARGANRAERLDGLKEKDLIGVPWRVAFALQADGWWLRSDIIWSKPNPMPESVQDRPTSSHEHVFLLTKSPKYFYDAEAVAEVALRAGDIPGGTDRYISDITGGHCKDGLKANGQRPVAPTRNLRNVWTIATAPYADAHFATFPPELAERCIKAGTSEKGCCANCGAPWVRVTEKIATGRVRNRADGGLGVAESRNPHGLAAVGGQFQEGVQYQTVGWSPSCQCKVLSGTGAERGEVGTVPCTVLDPFAGAFTAPMVADRLQRNAIGIELSEAYCSMARARLVADAGMFAEIAD